MRLLQRKEFLAQPAGVFFVKYPAQWINQELCVKDRTVSSEDGEAIDFWYHNLTTIDSKDSMEWIDRLEEMLDTGVSYPLIDAISRDGLFDETDMFLIFEKEDLIRLRSMVESALALE